MKSRSFGSFTEFREHVLTLYLDFYPTLASSLGLHTYDRKIEDFSHERRTRYVEELIAAKATLEKDHIHTVSDKIGRFERLALRWKIEEELFRFTDYREFEWNPMFYNEPLELTHLLQRDYAPLEERTRAALARIRAVPTVLAIARQNLLPVIDRTIVETAIMVFQGRLGYYDELFDSHFKHLSDPLLLSQLDEAIEDAKIALSSFIDSMQIVLLPMSTYNSFRLGTELYSQLLYKTELITEDPAALLKKGYQELDRLTARFLDAAKEIDPLSSPQEVFRQFVESEHFSERNLIPEVTRMLERIRQFVIDRNLVTVPSNVRCTVEPTPAHMRWAFAAMNSPGAFEQVATEAFYYVTPPEGHWDEEKKREFLHGFNRSVMEVISIHEAYPGHYTHFLHLQNARSSVGKVFWSYGFIEGWAHYAEEMMIDEGWGQGDARTRMAAIQEALIRLCRYIVAIERHAGSLTLDEASRFFEEKAMMRPVAARREAERGVFDPLYLLYTLGKFMIFDIRDRARAQPDFSLRSFHDELLSYGTAPLPIVKELMLSGNA